MRIKERESLFKLELMIFKSKGKELDFVSDENNVIRLGKTLTSYSLIAQIQPKPSALGRHNRFILFIVDFVCL